MRWFSQSIGRNQDCGSDQHGASKVFDFANLRVGSGSKGIEMKANHGEMFDSATKIRPRSPFEPGKAASLEECGSVFYDCLAAASRAARRPEHHRALMFIYLLKGYIMGANTPSFLGGPNSLNQMPTGNCSVRADHNECSNFAGK